jgi:2-polyprenyl-6-methoxyphenol hydroxylase-like FAD-dependent oxidoreductase
MSRHAIISGAGIAGPALAHELTRRGWRTTVLERAPERRDQGSNVDVRGAAREVARRMGIEEDIRAANTGEVGMRFVKDNGSAAAQFPMDSSSERDGPTAELEILRGELSRILIEHTRDSTEYRFNTQIAGLTDDGDHIWADLDDGTAIDADVVVIAEGMRSRTRDLVLPLEVSDLGMYIAYLTIARQDTDDQWWNWHHLPGSRAVHLRPDNLGTTRAMLSFVSDVRGLEDLARDDQVAILRRNFADAADARRILAALDQAPLYFDALGQVRAPHWSKGRVALLGDSAYCVSPVGGGGSSLALIGAYVLAGELARADDHRTALTSYEQFMRPHVASAQDVRPWVLRAANPRSRAGISALHATARLAASPPARAVTNSIGRRFGRVSADDLRLPDYSDVSTTTTPNPPRG